MVKKPQRPNKKKSEVLKVIFLTQPNLFLHFREQNLDSSCYRECWQLVAQSYATNGIGKCTKAISSD